MLSNAIINPLEMPTENNEIFSQRQRIGHRLIELLTIRSCKNYLVVFSFCLQSIDAALYGLYFHNHSGKPTKRIIIYPAILIFCIIAKIMNVDFCKPLILSAFHYGAVEEAFNHFRQNSDDVNTHILNFSAKIV